MGKEGPRDLHRAAGNVGWSWHHCSEQHQPTRAQSSCDTSQRHLAGFQEDWESRAKVAEQAMAPALS